jgi:hypothetical protein
LSKNSRFIWFWKDKYNFIAIVPEQIVKDDFDDKERSFEPKVY